MEEMQCKLDPGQSLKDIPKKQKQSQVKPLAYYADRYKDRDQSTAHAYRSGHYTLEQVGAHFGVSYGTVSRAVKLLENRDCSQVLQRGGATLRTGADAEPLIPKVIGKTVGASPVWGITLRPEGRDRMVAGGRWKSWPALNRWAIWWMYWQSALQQRQVLPMSVAVDGRIGGRSCLGLQGVTDQAVAPMDALVDDLQTNDL